MSPESIAGAQAAVANSPARQERLAMAARAPATQFVDGEGYMPMGRPAYGSGARNLQTSRVGVGTMSNGMTGGGAIGSSLMMGGAAVPGMAMGGVPQQPRQPAVNAFETAKATAAGMQRAPTVMQTEDGGARIFGSGAVMRKPTDEQADRRSAFADAMEARRGRVQERGIARGREREERMQFASDAQTMGRNPALIRAFERQGIAPERAMAMMGAMSGDRGAAQFLSEDNRQRGVADAAAALDAREQRRLQLEEENQAFQQDYLNRQPQKPAIEPDVAAQLTAQSQADYDKMVAEGMPPTVAQQQVQQRYSQIQPGFTFSPYKPHQTPTRLPNAVGVPQAVIDRMRASGDPEQVAAAAEAERTNRELEGAHTAAGASLWPGSPSIIKGWMNRRRRGATSR
jgi:hypothetical protein